MHFTSLLSAFVISVTIIPAQGLWMRGYSSTVSCSGTYFYCDLADWQCCQFPGGYGYSVQFDGLPAGTKGQGYTGDNCHSYLFTVYGPGTKCWNGGGARAQQTNWFYDWSRSIHPARAVDAAAGPNTNCSVPATGFVYTAPDGVEHTLKVPEGDKDAPQNIADLYLAKDFDALAKYEEA